MDQYYTVYIATGAGVFFKENGSSKWTALPFSNPEAGPAYAVVLAPDGTLWMGTWKGVFQWKNHLLRHIAGTSGPIPVVCPAKEGMYALGPGGVWLYDTKTFIKKNYPVARSIRSAVSDTKGGLWIASDVGLYHATDHATAYIHHTDTLLSAGLTGLALINPDTLWVGGLGGVSILEKGKRVRAIRPADGCPSAFVNCVQRSPEGVMWVGTKVGAVRFYADGKHSLRFSRRWLLDDKVNAITFDKDGTAWIATAKGVSAIIFP